MGEGYFSEEEVGISDFFSSLKCSIRPVWHTQCIMVEPMALLNITACHSVTRVIAYPKWPVEKGGNH